MNFRSPSYHDSPQTPRRPSRPSFSSGLSFSISTAEQGQNVRDRAHNAAHQIEDEIEEIKRYEDFTTIGSAQFPLTKFISGKSGLFYSDWVQDAAREEARRRARRRENEGVSRRNGGIGWRRRLMESYEAGQAWLVVTLIGAAIGLNAAFLNIVTEWLSDVKLGYCCDEWHPWTSLSPINYVIYIIFSLLFALVSATLVRCFAPYAAGSGISEIKCIIAGFVMKGFLGFWTLLIKSIGLPLSIASGLSVGKEGPSVHYAVCTGNVISRLFEKYKRNAAKTREILTASPSSVRVSVQLTAFKEMSSHFPLKTLWRSYFCALVATAVLAAMNPFRTGQLVMFQVKYDRSWHFFEIIFFIVIGVFGGLYGAFVMKWNLRAQAFRKRYLTRYALLEASILAAATAIVCYPNMFLRIDMTESMKILFLECEGGHDYDGLCEHRWSMVISLAIATTLRIFLVIISYGCKVPAGIFVPSMAIGASFGRMVGILVQALHEAMPDSRFFASCEPDVPCITPGTYAFLGAGAALSGIMHITVSVVVIMFELTGALTYILPTMIVVGVTKAVGDRFGKGGIADRMIWFNGFPFLDNKEEHTFGVPVSSVMTTDLTVLPTSGLDVKGIEKLLDRSRYQGFPVVEDLNAMILVGYIGRTELRYALERAKREQTVSPNARCFFGAAAPTTTNTRLASPSSSTTAPPPSVTFDTIPATSGQMSLDLSRFMDPTPLAVHPRQPLETVMELFKKMGPRVILVEYRGRLTGLVTVKDCLKYQFKVEASSAGNPRDESAAIAETQERLWALIQHAATWVADKASRVSRGRIKLAASPLVPRRSSAVASPGSPGQILEGTEEEDVGVELDER
ncbi:MAG: glycerol ethanol, ferric requiring protein [Peltula sp. TS41687]|nr:MAG: glycerol ethanol, ferric requiring protein [Peltula sp. TS41687]